MPTGNINVDHVDINSLSDTPLNQIKPIEDLPTEGTVSSPTGDQDISNAPLQISSSKRISLKTLAQYFDHILSQNNNLKDLKLDGNYNVDASFNKLINEISNGEITYISQILGDPKMTNSIWLFLVKTLYDLSKAQLNSFKSYTGFPADLSNPSSLGIKNNISSILMGLDKFIIGEDNLEDWGIELGPNDRYPYLINPLWPLDSSNSLSPNFNPWDQITSITERIYYLFKWTFSLANPTTGFGSKPWEKGNKTLYQRIVDLENAVGISEGDNLTTRVSHLENKLLLLYKNSLAKRNEVLIYPDNATSISPLTLKGGTDYQITTLLRDSEGLTYYAVIPSELIIDFNDFLYENPLDSEDNINISQLSSDNITPLDPNKSTVLFEIDHLIPYLIYRNVSVNVGSYDYSNKSSITNLLSEASKNTELPPWPDPDPQPRGSSVNYILGNGLNGITLTLNNKPDNLRVLIHEPIVNGGINPDVMGAPGYENTLFGNLNNDYSGEDDSNSLNGPGYFKLEFIYNPSKSIHVAGEHPNDYYTHPTLEVNVYIKLSFNPPS